MNATTPRSAPPPSRLKTMQPSAIRDVHDLAVRLGEQHPEREFIALHFGEPDLGTPEFIVEAGCAALRAGAVFYENNAGRADLRAALSEHFGIDARRFTVTCGAVQAICLSMFSLVRPGDDVIILTPLWPNFTEAARMAGANIHEIPLKFNDNERCFELDETAIEDGGKPGRASTHGGGQLAVQSHRLDHYAATTESAAVALP